MKKILFFLLLIFPTVLIAQKDSPSAQEQEQRITDLKKRVNLNRLSSKDRKNLGLLRDAYRRINLDSSLYYAELELKLSMKTEDPNLISISKVENAWLLWRLQKPDEARKLLLENISIKNKIADTIMSETYYILANVEGLKQRPGESIKYVLKASKLYKLANDSSRVADCFAYIAGICTFVLFEHDNAIPYFEKALAHVPSDDKSTSVRINVNYSCAYVEKSNFEQALKRNQVAERQAKKFDVQFLIPDVYAQYAYLYHKFGKYDKSLEYALLGESVVKKMRVKDGSTRDKIYWYLGVNYKELKEYTKAIDYFEMLLDSYTMDHGELQSNLIELYAAVGNYEHAFKLQKQLLEAKDSSDFLARNQQVLDVVEKYETEKKQQKIRALSAQKNRQKSQLRTQRLILFGTIAFFLVLIITGAFWYRTRTKLKETQLNLETTKLQQRFLRTQLNPHFLFHALTSIETYIYKNDKLESAKFLRSFSVLMRNILESSDVDFIPLQQDIDFITKYIELQQLNNEFKFDYEITVSPELNTEEIMIPPMLLQPAVENAILHGALSVEHGLISIEYSKAGDQLQITVRDNGKARNMNQNSSNRLHRSMSLDITQTRIKNLEEVHGITIAYSPFDSTKYEQHSLVSFKMPLAI